MTHEVFISYSHHDKAVADGICANLEADGIRCWIAPRDIAPGHDWPSSISEAISGSRVMVLIFSSRANKSEDVGRELILAADSNLIIVPFKIEDIEPEPGKKYYLARTHWLDAMDPPTQEQVDKLVSCVHSLLVEAGVELADSSLTIRPPLKDKVQLAPSNIHEQLQPSSAITREADRQPRVGKKVASRAAKSTQSPASASPQVPVGKTRSPLLRVMGIAFAGLVLLVGIPLILENVFDIPVLSPFFSAPSPTATITATHSPTTRPSRTPEPSPTNTSPPSWVSSFAQPILDAVAGLPPSFQDDFGPSSAGWYNPNEWQTSRIKYEDGEIIVTGCGLAHAGLDVPDFVLEVDGRFLTFFYWDYDWGIKFRDTSCMPCEIAVHYMCDISLKIAEDYFIFDDMAHCNYKPNHLTLIAKGNSFAAFINDQPVYFTNYLVGRWGGISLSVWNDGSTTSDQLPSVAFDNFKLWDIYNLVLP